MDSGTNQAPHSHYLDAVQIGRAFAAMAVALLHVVKDTDRLYLRYADLDPGLTSTAAQWHELLAAGVDVFFVISGVVMVLSTSGKTDSSKGWQPTEVGSFIYRRFTRIYPLYWVLTLIYIAALALMPHLFQENTLDAEHAIGSLLLIPTVGPDGVAFPLIYAGWTLTYELMFYGFFALSLFVAGDKRSTVVCIFLIVAWHLLHYTPLANITAIFRTTENVLLEFVFGMLLGRLWLRRSFNQAWALPLIVVGLILLLLSAAVDESTLPRVLRWGVPSFLIVAGLMCWQPGSSRTARVLVHLGAASYALYLFHFFALRVYFMVLGKSGMLAFLPPIVCVVLALLFATVSSVIVFHLLEQPLLKLTRRWQPARLGGHSTNTK